MRTIRTTSSLNEHHPRRTRFEVREIERFVGMNSATAAEHQFTPNDRAVIVRGAAAFHLGFGA